MKTRRGSSLWPTTLSGATMVNQYKPGDIVTSSLTRESDFIGVVRGVDPKINKVWVAWAGGAVGQHDPDEIHFEPHQSETVKSRMASRRPFADRTAATHQEISKGVRPSRPCKAGDLFHSGRGLQCGNCGAYAEDHGKTWEMAPEGKSRRSAADPATDPQFVGDPAAHGMDKPIGGGFSIMQNLVKDQRQEMHEESQGGQPKMATLRSRRAMEFPTQEDMDKYLKEHPGADKSLHRVVESKPQYQISQAKHDLGNKSLALTSHTYSDDGSFFLDLKNADGLMVGDKLNRMVFKKEDHAKVHSLLRDHLGGQDFSTEAVKRDPFPSKAKLEKVEEALSALDTNKTASLRSRQATKKTAGYLKEKFPSLYQKAMRTYGNDPLYVAVIDADDIPSLNKAMQTLKSIRGPTALANLRWLLREGLKTASELRSRRAMYWSNPDRIYRLTKREIVDSSALCPKCREEMSLEPYTKNDRMYCCSKCKFKIPKSNVIVASLKSRRSAVSAS